MLRKKCHYKQSIIQVAHSILLHLGTVDEDEKGRFLIVVADQLAEKSGIQTHIYTVV